MPHRHDPCCQAVVLAGASGSRLHPLNSGGTPKVLLPVANRPLLSFPLRTLEEAGVAEVLVLCEGDAAASAVQHWLAGYSGALAVEAVRVTEGSSPVEALRGVRDRLRAPHVVLLSGDVVTEVPLQAQLLTHRLRGAAVTPLLARRRESAAAETKPGQAPKNVDYVGLTADDGLAFYLHSPDRARQLRIPQRVVDRVPSLTLRTDLTDMHVYVFQTEALRAVLAARQDLHSLEEGIAWRCAAFLAPEGAYCCRANSLQAYAEVNRDVLAGAPAASLLREAPNAKYENFVHSSVQMGSKAAVGAGCMIGEDVVLGDKSTVKRSVIGPNCRIGAGAKIINSVLMADVTVEDGAHVHGSILCNRAGVGAGASLRDCQVSPEFRVGEGADLRGEVLASSR
ncbi:putative translation initiation factor eIF-2B subunit gamma [Auxenochlorella protothecoides]|uniref:Translation initiation factor eIF2B subunit gamma n=1 Tax=Auxenochlorella protothecoides TaxID=3075 RepID=A0A087SUC7_AUXPR|nr:putative translation initiation factor eIF-2B subunit gamma [Auxenochlorella protothecoides]KFM29331.1 putative translation initiation factor eIF-2B subunit gamma [Auxenochlorella protothecoides]